MSKGQKTFRLFIAASLIVATTAIFSFANLRENTTNAITSVSEFLGLTRSNSQVSYTNPERSAQLELLSANKPTTAESLEPMFFFADVASDGFENVLSIFTETTGTGTFSTGNSGSGESPATSPFAAVGTYSYGKTNGSVTITSSNIDTSSFTSNQLVFRLAAFSLVTATNGLDGGDITTVSISPDGGTNYFSTVRVLGNGNARWAYTASGNASTAYDGNATPVDFTPAAGGVRTTDGYSTVTVTGLPAVSNLRVRITLLNDSANERWVVDDLKVTGAPAGPSPEPTNQPTAFAAGTATNSTIPLTWTAAVAGAQAPSGYLIKVSTGAITDPVDGTQPTDDTDATDGSGVKSVTPGSASSFAGFTSSPGTSYNFKIYSYTNSGATIDYKLDSPPSVTASTIANPPTLIAAVGATVDGAFNVTFTDNPTWRAAITGVTIGGTPLTAGYSVSAGQITFTPSASAPANLLQTAGTKNIAIQATGYGDAAVVQGITHGAAVAIAIGVIAPAQTTSVASANITVSGSDQYGNACTTNSTTVITMTSASGNVEFDTNLDSTYGDNVRALTGGVMTFRIRNAVAEITTITATDENSNANTSANITWSDVTVSTDHFRSKTTGNWGDASTWESSHDYLTWFNATLPPTATSSTVTIRNGHNVSVASSVSTDNTTVDAGGTLTVNSTITLTIANGSGTDLTVNGTVVNSNVVTPTGTISFGATGKYQHARNGGLIPTSTWGTGSLVEVTGITSTQPTAAGMGQSFSNFTWNCPSQGGSIGLGNPVGFAVTGTLTITSTGGVTDRAVRLTGGTNYSLSVGTLVMNGGHLGLSSGSGTGTLNVAGNATLSNGSELYMSQSGSANGTLYVGGDLSVTSATITETGTTAGHAIIFNKSGTQSFTASSATLSENLSYNVNSGSTVNLSGNIPLNAADRFFQVDGTLNMGTSVVTGSGTFILGATGTLGIGSPDGLSITGGTGNIQSTVANRAYAAGSTFVYNGAAAQAIGNGLPASVTNLTIDNAAGVTLSTDVTVNGTLNLTQGNITSASNTIFIPATGTVSRTSGHVVGNLQKTFSATGVKDFEVGTANGYSPVSVNATAITGTPTMTVKAIEGAMPGITGTNKLARYWRLSSVGTLTSDLTFNYLPGDVVGTESSYQFVKSSSSVLTVIPPSSNGVNYSIITGVTNFSDWTLAEPSAVTYAITPSAGAGGTITPNTVQNVPYTTSQAFAISANVGFAIADVLVDGGSVGAVSNYNFPNVTATHTISATFVSSSSAPTVSASAATGITQVAATLNGDVTADGGAAITERGFYWKSGTGVTTGNGTKVVVAGTTGPISANLSLLSASTQYSYIAFATNSVGTTASTPEVTFTTAAAFPAAITRSSFTDSYSAISTGGGATQLVAGTGSGDFSFNNGVADPNDGVAYVPLPFGFSLKGTSFVPGTNFLGISVNGMAYFSTTNAVASKPTAANSKNNDNLFTQTGQNNVLAPYWSDLTLASVNGITGTSILYQTTGAPGSRVLTIQWTNMPSSTGAPARSLNFQTKLYEATGVIEFSYGPVTDGITFPGGTTGESASIGLRYIAAAFSGNFMDALTGSGEAHHSMTNSGRVPKYNFRFTPGTPTALATGTYNVGVGQTYPNLTEAAADVNQRGVSGPVTFNLTDATYDTSATNGSNIFPIFIGPINGTSATNTVTFSASGARPTINGNQAASPDTRGSWGTYDTPAFGGGSSSEPLICVVGTQYLTLQNLALTTSGGTEFGADRGLQVVSGTLGASNNTFRDLSITLNRSNGASTGIEQVKITGGITNSFNKYYNLTLQNMNAGIKLSGAGSGFVDTGNEIGVTGAVLMNTIGAATANDIGSPTGGPYGIWANNQQDVKIFNNEVRNLTASVATGLDGIFVSGFRGTGEVHHNVVHDIRNSSSSASTSVTGINVKHLGETSSAIRVYNNLIYGISSACCGAASSAIQLRGIWSTGTFVNGTQEYDIDFNSVYLDHSAAPNTSSACFDVTSTTAATMKVRNNICANVTSGQSGVARHTAWNTPSASSIGAAGSVSDRNIFYIPDTSRGPIGIANGVDKFSLANWQSVAGTDANSKTSNPRFISATNLHIDPSLGTDVESNGSYFSGAISWVGTDIDGDTRNATTPDIGADEGAFTLQLKTVTFNGNGSDGGSMSPQAANTATNLTTNGFTRIGFTFAGWNTIAGGGGTAYANGASYPFTADVTLYAQWTALVPTVTNVSPGSGSTVGGEILTITGTNFTGVTGVTVGGSPATSFSFINSTSITAVAPSGSAGTASVEVTTPGGTSDPNTLYTYVDPPAVPSIGSSTPASPGASTTPTINGTAEVNSTVNLYTAANCLSGSLGSGTATGGSFAIGVTVTANTTTTIYATATNAGGTSGCSGGFSYKNDIILPDTELDTGGRPTDPTTSTSATFTFNGTDSLMRADAQSPITFECNRDGLGYELCTSPKLYPGLLVGSHTFQVRARDQAGNVDPTPASYTWLIVAPPTLGNYDNETVAFAGSATVTPSAPPANATNLTVSAGTGYAGAFAGGLTINQTTGVVFVTDAHPAGTYTVTVNAFGPGAVATDTFVLTVSPGATCGLSSFDTADNYAVGTNPNTVVTADINLDGKPDMVVANGVSNNVSVLIGDGLGGFGAAANFAVGDHPNSIAVADFDLDGNPDIATANDVSSNITVLFGDGSGGVSSTTSFGAGNTPFGLVAADFNFDGKPDLAVANAADDFVTVFIGNGIGGFAVGTTFAVGDNPIAASAGDFNNDGMIDLVVANNVSNNVSVLIGDGLGGFAAAANFGVGSVPQYVTVGDLDHDGNVDIVATTTAGLGASVLLGNGLGGFGAATNYNPGVSPIGVAISDLNLDGDPDLVVTNFTTAPNVSVMLGDGTGAFGPQTLFSAGDNARSVATGDFDLDGKPDLAVANSVSDDVSVLLNICDPPVVDLSITKTDGGATVAPGGTVAYTLNYANNGTVNATGVVLTETVPAHSSFNTGLSDPGWVCADVDAGSTCTLAVGSLAYGASGSAVFAITIEDPIIGVAAQINNTATIADDATHGADDDLSDNTGSDSTPIPITFAINDVTANEGDAGPTSFTFTITKTRDNGLPTTITFQTCDGTAFAPDDYTAIGSCSIVVTRPAGSLIPSDEVTFSPTEMTKQVTVYVNGDTTVEPDETFTLKLVGTTNGAIIDAEGLGTITNDDVTYTLGVATVGSGSVTKDPDQANYNDGTVVELTAVPDVGWTFNGWSGDTEDANYPNRVPLVIITGKSNSGGYAVNADATPTELSARPGVQILNNNSLLFEDLDIGTNNLIGHAGLSDNATHGFELGLANSVAAAEWPNSPVYLVKTGQGGSTISQWSAGSPYWITFNQRVTAAMDNLTASGKTPMVYILYSHGINDALLATPVATWKTDTIEHLAKIRRAVGPSSILMTRLMPAYDNYNTAIDEIDAADDLSLAISVSGATLRDANHWDYDGMKLISSRMVTEMRASGGGSVTANPLSVTMDRNRNLTAHFVPIQYNVSYNANGGSGTAPATQTADYNSSVTLASNTFTNTGFAFSGWNTAANGSGSSHAAGSSFTIPAGNTTMYAQWTPLPPDTPSVSNSPQTYSGSPIPITVSCMSGGTATGITPASASNAGTYPVTASCPGNGSFAATTNAPAGDFIVDPATPTVTVTVGAYTYNGAPNGPTAYTTNPTGDLGAATWTYVGTGATTYGPGPTRPTNAGTYTAQVSLDADMPNFLPGISAPTAFTIGKATQAAVTVNDPGSVVYGTSPTLTASGGSGSGAVTFSHGTSTACSITSGGVLTVINATTGTCEISATKAADGNYNAATSAAAPIALIRAHQAVNFNPLSERTLGDPPFVVSATGGTSGNPVTFASQTPAVCTTGGTNGETITLIAVGTCTIRASQAGNDNYEPAPNVDQNFDVIAATHTVVFDANGGSGSMANQSANAPTALTANNFTRSGYTFAGWATSAGGPVVYANAAIYSFAVDATLYAKWTLIVDSYLLTVNSANGTVVSTPAGINCPGDCSESFDDGTVVTLEATPYTGYRFVNWSAGVTNTAANPTTVTMDSAKTITANYALNTISGLVNYATFTSGSKGVPNVGLSAAGSIAQLTSTDLGGYYSMSGFGAGAYTVTPAVPATQPCLVSNGITALDSSLVQQQVVGLIDMTTYQKAAAKVTGTLTPALTSFDAALIAQKSVGICSPPIIKTGQWVMTPASRSHTVVDQDITDSFDAYMMGDVDGDWDPFGASRPAPARVSTSPDAVQVGLPTVTGDAGTRVSVPMRFDNMMGRGVTSYQFDIQYDPTVIEPAELAADLVGAVDGELSIVSNAPEPGVLKVTVYGAYPATGDGVYANLHFNVRGATGTSSPLAIRGFMLNDDRWEVNATDGVIVVGRSNAERPSIKGRVLTTDGAGVLNAIVTLTSSTGKVQSMRSAAGGTFEFNRVVAGETYTLTVQSKRFRYQPMTIILTGSAVDLDIVGF